MWAKYIAFLFTLCVVSARKWSLDPNDDNGTMVGFTIELSASKALSHDVPITFDDVLIDNGDDFTPLLGTFTCPDNGIYAFFWTIAASLGRVSAELMIDGEPVKYGPLTQETPGEFSGTSSMGSVLQCSTGSMVWLKAVTWPDNTTCNQIEGEYSSFTGFKIFEEGDTDASVFSAELSVNTTVADYMIYDRILFDVGNDYHPVTGAYVCPQNGTYVFITSCHVASSDEVHYLVKNGQYDQYPVYAYNPHDSTQDSGTSSGVSIIQCTENDVLRLLGVGREHVARLSSWTGFQLNSDIAFMARLSDNKYYFGETTIVYDEVVTNVGGQYIPTAGWFVCPDDDDDHLFFLTWAVLNYEFRVSRQTGEVRLLTAKDGEITVAKKGPKSSTVPEGDTYLATVSSHVVVQCERNRAFYVQTVIEDDEPMYFEWLYNYFGGFSLPKFD